MSETAVQITGLAEFAKGLRKLDADAPKALRVALNGAAGLLIGEARKPIPRRSGRAAASLTARSTRTAVRVGAGGRRAAYYPWLDYGGAVGRGRSVKRPFLKEGRYLYPAYFRLKASGEFEAELAGALVAVAEAAGLEVT